MWLDYLGETTCWIDLWSMITGIKIKVYLVWTKQGEAPIAGPLMVAGVIFPKGYQNALIDDSKKLSEKKARRVV